MYIQYIYKIEYKEVLYVQYLQGLCQSRLSTAYYALFLVAFATTAVLDTWTVVCLTAATPCSVTSIPFMREGHAGVGTYLCR
jgi:hypothetical protein